jgi:hypothetical protein
MHGPAGAPRAIVAFHALGCDTCARGSALLLALLDHFGGDVKLVAGDYFEPGRYASYRGAIALHCAPAEHRDALLRTLVLSFGSGRIDELVERAAAVGVERARFEDCLVMDRPLPVVFENLEMARRLGLERNVLGLFANGVRIGDLGDVQKVVEQIDRAFPPI